METILSYLSEHLLEIAGTILGVTCVVLEIRQHIATFIFSGLSALIYLVVFFQEQLYFSMTLYLLFLLLAIHGFWNWRYRLSKQGQFWVSTVKSIKFKIIVIAITLFLATILGFFMHKYTDTRYSFLDATITSLSILGSWCLNHKKIEVWYIWIITNTLSILLYLLSGLYLTVVLYGFYLAISVRAYIVWKKALEGQVK